MRAGALWQQGQEVNTPVPEDSNALLQESD
jgi:hypothetical protein